MQIPKELYAYDKKDQRSYLTNPAKDIKEGYEQDLSNVVERLGYPKPSRVTVCGMGGSAIAPDLLNAYLNDLEINVNRRYEFPYSLEDDDLVIISSYSGNTEEVISCYRKARRSNADVAIISTGGRLENGLDTTKVPIIKLPKGYLPRAALPYTFATFLAFFEALGLTPTHREEMEELHQYLLKHDLEEHGYSIAQKMEDTLPIVYADQAYEPVAYRWQTQLNENAKTLAISNTYSEANHNEICGYRNHPGTAHVFMIGMDDDHSRIKKRFKLTKDIIKQQGIKTTEIRLKGTKLTKMFSAILLGDWASYYLALLYETDPSEVNEIDELKDRMGRFI